MFGFIFGTACLIGLVKLARRGGCGGGYYGGHGHWGRGFRGGWGGGGPQSWMLRGLSYRIGATPGQEKVIGEAFENIRNAFSKIHDEKEKARRDVATAFKQETFDHGPMKDAFTRADGILEEIQRTILVELSKVHEALNPEQRKQVADLLENGFGGGWRHQGYGGGWRHGYRGGPWAAAGDGGRCGGGRYGGRSYDETSNNNDANVA